MSKGQVVMVEFLSVLAEKSEVVFLKKLSRIVDGSDKENKKIGVADFFPLYEDYSKFLEVCPEELISEVRPFVVKIQSPFGKIGGEDRIIDMTIGEVIDLAKSYQPIVDFYNRLQGKTVKEEKIQTPEDALASIKKIISPNESEVTTK